MEKNKESRYRLSDAIVKRLGLKKNKTGRYRLTRRQEEVLLAGNKKPKILIYDIETSRGIFKAWWSGKRYIQSTDVIREPAIISVAWKWLGEDKVYSEHWNLQTHCDRNMLERFLVHYNDADLVIGQNNDKFDNRWVGARAMKHKLRFNPLVKSLDLMKMAKKHFRVLGYSMAYLTDFMDVERKQQHEGIIMWDMIEDGPMDKQMEYMDKMIDYNRQDIVATEAMYVRMLPYIGQKVHLGMFMGGQKADCPGCGGHHVRQTKVTYTAAGTIQHIMECEDCGSNYKISNKTYLDFLSE